MTYSPATLLDLQRYWVSQGGVSLGIVGDTNHLNTGTSYHLGKDNLKPGAYSIQTTRDRRGATDAASAIDLGKLNDTYSQMTEFSVWLVDRARHASPGTEDMREIIYTPDGMTVLRWDRERGFGSRPQPGEASLSHRFHTHISWYRDSQQRDHKTAFVPYFEEHQPSKDEMQSYAIPKYPSLIDVKTGARLYKSSDLVPNNDPRTGDKIIEPGRSMPYYGAPFSGVRQVEYINEDGIHSGVIYFCHPTDLSNQRPLPIKDCKQEIAIAIKNDRANARIVYTP